MKYLKLEGRSSLKKWSLVVGLVMLVSNFVWAAKSWQEDVNGGGVKEQISIPIDRTSAGHLYYKLTVSKGNAIYFCSFIETEDDAYLIKDVSKEFSGKEIITCHGQFTWYGQKTAQYEIRWFGWDNYAKKYSLYNFALTKKQYGRWAKTRPLKEFKLSGEAGRLYHRIKSTRLFLQYLRVGKWTECEKTISPKFPISEANPKYPDGYIHNWPKKFITGFRKKTSQIGGEKVPWYIPYCELRQIQSSPTAQIQYSDDIWDITWFKAEPSYYLIFDKTDQDFKSRNIDSVWFSMWLKEEFGGKYWIGEGEVFLKK